MAPPKPVINFDWFKQQIDLSELLAYCQNAIAMAPSHTQYLTGAVAAVAALYIGNRFYGFRHRFADVQDERSMVQRLNDTCPLPHLTAFQRNQLLESLQRLPKQSSVPLGTICRLVLGRSQPLPWKWCFGNSQLDASMVASWEVIETLLLHHSAPGYRDSTEDTVPLYQDTVAHILVLLAQPVCDERRPGHVATICAMLLMHIVSQAYPRMSASQRQGFPPLDEASRRRLCAIRNHLVIGELVADRYAFMLTHEYR